MFSYVYPQEPGIISRIIKQSKSTNTNLHLIKSNQQVEPTQLHTKFLSISSSLSFYASLFLKNTQNQTQDFDSQDFKIKLSINSI